MPPVLQFGMFHGIQGFKAAPSRGTVLLGCSKQPALGLQEIWFDSKAALVQQSDNVTE